ncbi:hypothetical protein GCM10023342_14220 [Modicisalibacter zincidurans]|uniref:Uncharacterized protein n=1 Tax=Modicisalibacter zincidurans TaxID=1178777 RepID=A0ABP9R7S1_9GAMM
MVAHLAEGTASADGLDLIFGVITIHISGKVATMEVGGYGWAGVRYLFSIVMKRPPISRMGNKSTGYSIA